MEVCRISNRWAGFCQLIMVDLNLRENMNFHNPNAILSQLLSQNPFARMGFFQEFEGNNG